MFVVGVPQLFRTADTTSSVPVCVYKNIVQGKYKNNWKIKMGYTISTYIFWSFSLYRVMLFIDENYVLGLNLFIRSLLWKPLPEYYVVMRICGQRDIKIESS